MEGMFFIADIVFMLILVFAIFRAERKEPPGDLGLFSYKADIGKDDNVREDQHNA